MIPPDPRKPFEEAEVEMRVADIILKPTGDPYVSNKQFDHLKRLAQQIELKTGLSVELNGFIVGIARPEEISQ